MGWLRDSNPYLQGHNLTFYLLNYCHRYRTPRNGSPSPSALTPYRMADEFKWSGRNGKLHHIAPVHSISYSDNGRPPVESPCHRNPHPAQKPRPFNFLTNRIALRISSVDDNLTGLKYIASQDIASQNNRPCASSKPHDLGISQPHSIQLQYQKALPFCWQCNDNNHSLCKYVEVSSYHHFPRCALISACILALLVAPLLNSQPTATALALSILAVVNVEESFSGGKNNGSTFST